MSGAHLIRARAVADGAGLRQGDLAVAVDGERIVDCADFAALRARMPHVPVREMAAVSVPLANAHTHLDLTHYPKVRAPFEEFVRAISMHRQTHPEARGLQAAKEGMREAAHTRTAAMGDIIAREPVLLAELQSAWMPGVAYWEVVCPSQDAAPAVLQALRQRIDAWQALQRPGGPVLGLSPHSPWLVCADVLRELARWSVTRGLPLQIHVAESPAEMEFFRTGQGPLAQALASMNWRVPPTPATLGFKPDPALTPVRYLADIGFLRAAPTIVHGVQVSDEDVRIIAEHGCPVVLCPRSNHHLRCGAPDWRRYERAGVHLALATDSAMSAQDLDLMAEMRAASSLLNPAPSPATLLGWMTAGAGRVLRLPPRRIAAGESARGLMLFGAGAPA